MWFSGFSSRLDRLEIWQSTQHIITQGDMHLKCVFSFRERELMIGSKASGELTVSISTSGEEDILLLLSI